MKKLAIGFGLVLIAGLVLMSTFSSNAVTTSQELQTEILKKKCKMPVYENASDTIIIKKGKKFQIKLSSNPSTGYSWSYTGEAEEVSMLASEYVADENPEQIAGKGGNHFFTFKITQKGDYSLFFLNARTGSTEGEQTTFHVVCK